MDGDRSAQVTAVESSKDVLSAIQNCAYLFIDSSDLSLLAWQNRELLKTFAEGA
jgi:hypothetical protein